MDNELNLDLDQIEADAEKGVEIKNRYKQLSEKLIQEKKEKEEITLREAEKSKALDAATKERDFYKDFSTHSAKYPAAAEYQEAIREKVSAGYTTEDAIVSTLAREGKLTGNTEQPTFTGDVAGGSAINQVRDIGDKTIEQMSPDEKLAKLMELESKGEFFN